MTSTFNREDFLKNIRIISNNLEDNLENEDYDIFENLNYLYSFLNAFSLAFIFSNVYENSNNFNEKNILLKFSCNTTDFNLVKIKEHNINDKESIDYILFIIDDTINVYKYNENKIHVNDNNTLSINPFLFKKNKKFNENNLNTNNDKIINILNKVKKYLKNL